MLSLVGAAFRTTALTLLSLGRACTSQHTRTHAHTTQTCSHMHTCTHAHPRTHTLTFCSYEDKQSQLLQEHANHVESLRREFQAALDHARDQRAEEDGRKLHEAKVSDEWTRQLAEDIDAEIAEMTKE